MRNKIAVVETYDVAVNDRAIQPGEELRVGTNIGSKDGSAAQDLLTLRMVWVGSPGQPAEQARRYA
ncbi:MAG: hypothetical protein ACRDSN_08345 [Pseudonocardiaceae bacterium]